MMRQLITFAALLSFAHAEPFEESRFEKEILVTDRADAVQVEAAKNGDVYFIERSGNLRVYSNATRSTRTVGVIPSILQGEADSPDSSSRRTSPKTVGSISTTALVPSRP